MFGAALRIVDGDARVLFLDHASQGVVEIEIGGQGKDSVRGTITWRAVMLSSSSALRIISSCEGGICPEGRAAVTMSLSSSGEWTAHRCGFVRPEKA